jgi:hypothetical protein
MRGEALREWLLPDNVAVSFIYPGHIRTAQVAQHVGALPLIMSAEQAAAIIKGGLDRGHSFIAFCEAAALADPRRPTGAVATEGLARHGNAVSCVGGHAAESQDAEQRHRLT